MNSIDKHRLLDALRSRVELALGGLTGSQQAVQAGAIHEETRAEDPKDTRATEASYLARGLAERVARLQTDVARLATLELCHFAPDAAIALGALVGLEDEAGHASIVFLVPVGAGETLSDAGRTIQTLTPGSPLGRALMGSREGDEVEVRLPGGIQRLEVCWIC